MKNKPIKVENSKEFRKLVKGPILSTRNRNVFTGSGSMKTSPCSQLSSVSSPGISR